MNIRLWGGVFRCKSFYKDIRNKKQCTFLTVWEAESRMEAVITGAQWQRHQILIGKVTCFCLMDEFSYPLQRAHHLRTSPSAYTDTYRLVPTVISNSDSKKDSLFRLHRIFSHISIWRHRGDWQEMVTAFVNSQLPVESLSFLRGTEGDMGKWEKWIGGDGLF